MFVVISYGSPENVVITTSFQLKLHILFLVHIFVIKSAYCETVVTSIIIHHIFQDNTWFLYILSYKKPAVDMLSRRLWLFLKEDLHDKNICCTISFIKEACGRDVVTSFWFVHNKCLFINNIVYCTLLIKAPAVEMLLPLLCFLL